MKMTRGKDAREAAHLAPPHAGGPAWGPRAGREASLGGRDPSRVLREVGIRASIHLRAGDNNQSVGAPPDDRNGAGALNRRRALLASAAAAAGLLLPARRGQAIGDHAALRFARLHLPDLPNPRPSALRRLAMEIERRTSLVTVPEPIDIRPTDNELFRYPLLVLSGDRGFAPPTEAEVVRLRRFLTYGGFLLVDSAEGRASGRFDESVRALLARALPGDLPARVPDDHVIWKSFYVLRGVAGRILAAPYLEAVERDRRLAVVYTQNDLAGALARDGFGRWEHEVIPGGDTQREQAFRFAVNVVMYAFCLDYKTEQAHIEFILKTRRQRF